MAIESDEDFFRAVERQTDPLSDEDRDQLKAVLSSPIFLKLAKRILDDTDQMKNRFLAFNLGDSKELAAATKLQGEIAAYPRLFGPMVDEALKKEELKDETPVVEKTAPASP